MNNRNRTFEIWATVRLTYPLVSEAESRGSEIIERYIRPFGVSAPSTGEACRLIREEILDGEIEEYRGGEKSVEEMETTMRDMCISVGTRFVGIWYRGGRAFIPIGFE